MHKHKSMVIPRIAQNCDSQFLPAGCRLVLFYGEHNTAWVVDSHHYLHPCDTAALFGNACDQSYSDLAKQGSIPQRTASHMTLLQTKECKQQSGKSGSIDVEYAAAQVQGTAVKPADPDSSDASHGPACGSHAYANSVSSILCTPDEPLLHTSGCAQAGNDADMQLANCASRKEAKGHVHGSHTKTACDLAALHRQREEELRDWGRKTGMMKMVATTMWELEGCIQEGTANHDVIHTHM